MFGVGWRVGSLDSKTVLTPSGMDGINYNAQEKWIKVNNLKSIINIASVHVDGRMQYVIVSNLECNQRVT